MSRRRTEVKQVEILNRSGTPVKILHYQRQQSMDILESADPVSGVWCLSVIYINTDYYLASMHEHCLPSCNAYLFLWDDGRRLFYVGFVNFVTAS